MQIKQGNRSAMLEFINLWVMGCMQDERMVLFINSTDVSLRSVSCSPSVCVEKINANRCESLHGGVC